MVYSWQTRLVPHMKMVYFKVHLFRKAFVIRYINITFIWSDCAVVLPVVNHPNQLVSHRHIHCMKTLNGTARVGTQLQTFCSEALFSILTTGGERKLLLCFHLGEGLKLTMCQSDSTECVVQKWKNQKTHMILCIVIYIYIKICCISFQD